MSCWVAPAIAAEYWRVSLEHVLGKIQNGSIPTRSENGFTFVDIMPHVPDVAPAAAPRNEPPPPTYVVVSRDELEALGATEEQIAEEELVEEGLEHTIDPEEFTPDEQGELPTISWSSARSHAARLRVPPRRMAA